MGESPYRLSDTIVPIPDGQFTLPICTNKERFQMMLDALYFGGLMYEVGEYRHLVDFLDAMSRIVDGCVEFTDQCRTISLNDERIQWFPESPYAPLPEVPDGYEFHPWTIASSENLVDIIIAWGLGYKDGDVFTDLTKFPDVTDPENIAENYLNLPRFRVTGLVGKGTIKVNILSIPFGGRLVVFVDEFVDLLNIQAADTDSDASFPPESIISVIIETEITTDGEHTVDYVFYPTVETELPLLGGGGGVRSIELCGFGVAPMPEDPCCPETNTLLTKNNDMLSQILLLMQGGFKLVPIMSGEPPDELAGSCAPLKYDEDTDDEGDEIAMRQAVLCYVIYCYILHVLAKALTQMGLPLPAIEILFPLYLTSPTALRKIKVEYPPVLTIAALIQGIATAGADIDIVTCQMKDALSGELNTFATFKTSVPTESNETLLLPISGLVNATNQNKDNWMAFNEALIQAMDMAIEVDAFECPCTDPVLACPDDPIVLVDFNDHDATFEDMGGGIWKITQNTPRVEDGRYVAGMADIAGRCMKVEGAGDPEMPIQAINISDVHGCCGTSGYTGTGGFALPGNYTDVSFDMGFTPILTYYKFSCVPPEECE